MSHLLATSESQPGVCVCVCVCVCGVCARARACVCVVRYQGMERGVCVELLHLPYESFTRNQ